MSKILKPEDGIIYNLMGDAMNFKLTGEDTDQSFTFVEDTIKPGFDVTLHLHRVHSETFYIAEGTVYFIVGREAVEAKPGTIIHVTPNTPHSAHSAQTGKMLTIFCPGGLAGAMEEFRQLTPEQAQNPDIIYAISESYDIIDLSQPPIPIMLDFYNLLLAGDSSTLLSIFEGEPQINTPLQGAVYGEVSFKKFVEVEQAWLSSLEAVPHFFDITITPNRVVVEYILDLKQNGKDFDLPIALVADRQGKKLSAIRVYHSTWPINGTHLVRQPLLTQPCRKTTRTRGCASVYGSFGRSRPTFDYLAFYRRWLRSRAKWFALQTHGDRRAASLL